MQTYNNELCHYVEIKLVISQNIRSKMFRKMPITLKLIFPGKVP